MYGKRMMKPSEPVKPEEEIIIREAVKKINSTNCVGTSIGANGGTKTSSSQNCCSLKTVITVFCVSPYLFNYHWFNYNSHAKRQAQEVESISFMELEEGMDNTMATAAARKLYYLASLGMREKFNDRVAPNIHVVMDELLKVYQQKKT